VGQDADFGLFVRHDFALKEGILLRACSWHDGILLEHHWTISEAGHTQYRIGSLATPRRLQPNERSHVLSHTVPVLRMEDEQWWARQDSNL
jgi:hypothetical protein